MKNYVRETKVKYIGQKKVFDKLCNPKNVFDFFKNIIGEELQENFVVIYLNNKNIATGYSIISIGILSETIVHPREVFRTAIVESASSIIVAHNHPSGILTPSKEDIATTERLIKAGKLLGISVLDHVIISENNYLSLKEEGHIE